MFHEESLWLERVLEGLALAPGQLVLDVGSSDRHFRTVQQPYIDEHVDRPLRARGLRLLLADAKPAEGVDLVLDLTARNATTPAELERSVRVVICTNMLEHVVDREQVARRLVTFVAPDGTLIVTVPRRYPEHRDPIDTLYRPSPAEIETLFTQVEPRLRAVEKRVLTIRHPRHYTATTPLRRFVPWFRWQLAAVVFRFVDTPPGAALSPALGFG
jgi:hypothetical protein